MNGLMDKFDIFLGIGCWITAAVLSSPWIKKIPVYVLWWATPGAWLAVDLLRGCHP
jgi:hypothetical protein